MDLGLVLPQTGNAEAAEYAVRAENQGFSSVWLGELWGENSFVQLTEVAMRTTDVRLGSAIVNVFSRTPAVLAMGAASLSRVSDRRAVLGLGISTPRAIEDLHGVEYRRPIRRTRETVELVRAFLSEDAESVEYQGDVYDVSGFPPLDAPVPIFNAALGSANRELTGRLCDGWLPNNVPVSHLESAFRTVADAAEAADRDPDDITIAPWVHVVVCEDLGEAKDAIREKIAYYVGNVDGYEHAVATKFPDRSRRAARAWRSGDRSRANESITDEMVDELGIAATPDTVADRVREFAAHPVVDVPILNIPHHIDDALVETTVDHLQPDRW